MKDLLDFLRQIPALPPDQLVGLIAVLSIGLAIFTVFVVYRLATREDRR